jgi:hypothetical protein
MYTLRLAGSRLGDGRGVGEELLNATNYGSGKERSPTRRRRRGGTNVLNSTIGNVRLPNHGSIFFAPGQVLDRTAGPTHTLRLAGFQLGDGRGVGEELLKDTQKRVRVVERANVLAIFRRRVTQNPSGAGLQERKVHEANAAKVRLLIVFGDNLAESSDKKFRDRSKGHDTLILRRYRKVVQCKDSKVETISAFPRQELGKRRQNIVLSSGADHRDTVLLVTNIAKFINTLDGGDALLTLGVEHLFDKIGDIIERRRVRQRLGGITME